MMHALRVISVTILLFPGLMFPGPMSAGARRAADWPGQWVSEHGREVFGNVFFQLDGEIGNAAPSVDLPRFRKGLCGAGIEAGCAGAAQVFAGRV